MSAVPIVDPVGLSVTFWQYGEVSLELIQESIVIKTSGCPPVGQFVCVYFPKGNGQCAAEFWDEENQLRRWGESRKSGQIGVKLSREYLPNYKC